MYRVGFPFWKSLARNGMKVSFRVDVSYDKEAEVFIAISPDLRGFVVEAPTMDELIRESNDVIAMLMEEYLHSDRVVAEPVYHHLGAAVASS
jgi:predicted RNase H-like HicB family nuclease